MKLNDQVDPDTTASVDAPISSSQVATMRDELRTRYGLCSELLRTKDLARILGLNVRTIQNLLREGRFAIEHERLSSTSVVRLDDLARWLCGTEKSAINPPRSAEAPASQSEGELIGISKESRKKRVVAIADAVVKEIERKKRSRR